VGHRDNIVRGMIRLYRSKIEPNVIIDFRKMTHVAYEKLAGCIVRNIINKGVLAAVLGIEYDMLENSRQLIRKTWMHEEISDDSDV